MMKEAVGLLLIRIVFGFRLIYGTADNIFSWERMLEFEGFLASNGFPFPIVSAVVSVYAQFVAGTCWAFGFYTRAAALLMIVNFLVAIVGFHLANEDSYLNTAPAIHLLCVAILLLLAGPGKFAINDK